MPIANAIRLSMILKIIPQTGFNNITVERINPRVLKCMRKTRCSTYNLFCRRYINNKNQADGKSVTIDIQTDLFAYVSKTALKPCLPNFLICLTPSLFQNPVILYLSNISSLLKLIKSNSSILVFLPVRIPTFKESRWITL